MTPRKSPQPNQLYIGFWALQGGRGHDAAEICEWRDGRKRYSGGASMRPRPGRRGNLAEPQAQAKETQRFNEAAAMTPRKFVKSMITDDMVTTLQGGRGHDAAEISRGEFRTTIHELLQGGRGHDAAEMAMEEEAYRLLNLGLQGGRGHDAAEIAVPVAPPTHRHQPLQGGRGHDAAEM